MNKIIIHRQRTFEAYNTKYQSRNGLWLTFNPWNVSIPEDKIKQYEFKVGSCHGLVFFDRWMIFINAVYNAHPHNGDFEDFLEVFEAMAQDLKKDLVFVNFINDRLKHHLIQKRSFLEFIRMTLSDNEKVDGVIKSYKGKNDDLILAKKSCMKIEVNNDEN